MSAAFPAPVLFSPSDEKSDEGGGAGEVVATWNGNIFRVEHLDLAPPRRWERAARTTFTLGEHPDCDVHVPPEAVDGRGRVPIVRVVRHRLVAALLPEAVVSLRSADGTSRGLPYLMRYGRAVWSHDLPGLCEIVLEPGERLRQEVGSIVLFSRIVAARPRRPARRRIDRSMAAILLNSLTLHVIVLVLAWRWPEEPMGLAIEVRSTDWVDFFGPPDGASELPGGFSELPRWPPPVCPWNVGGRDLCGWLVDSCLPPPCDECARENDFVTARGSDPDDRLRAKGRRAPHEGRTRRRLLPPTPRAYLPAFTLRASAGREAPPPMWIGTSGRRY